MKNMTMAVDENILKKVRKVAIDKNTTVPALVRDYLDQLARHEDQKREEAINQLMKNFKSHQVKIGKRTWTRDELHER